MIPLCTSALAIGLHLGTYHFARGEGLRDLNPGAYAQCDRAAAGAFRNSEGRLSAWAGAHWARVLGPVDLTIGAATGYRRAPVVPLVVPSILLGPLRLTLLPPIKRTVGGIHAGLEVRL